MVMTSGTITVAPPSVPALHADGAVFTDISGLADVHGLFGGPGTARCKTLIPAEQLPGGWEGVTYVELPPGAGCGRPLRSDCEELYYIISGQGQMTVNDLEEIPVEAGDLICCPLGTIHGIRVPGTATEPMAYFTAAVRPGNPVGYRYTGLDKSPRQVIRKPKPMPQLLGSCAGFRGGGHNQDTRVAVANLAPIRKLTGPWHRFSLIEIPPEDILGADDVVSRTSEVLFVIGGKAEITVGNVTAKGETGLCVSVPLYTRPLIRNLSCDQDLYVISTEVAV
jgi:mannose-6-phosphate isomerase-like protein (cupin superfamily)